MFQGAPSGKIELSFSDTPKICTGIQKLAQIFTVTLLTKSGSVLADSTFGTEQIGEIGKSNNILETVQQAAQLAVFNAYASIRDEQVQIQALGTFIPTDEIITNAQVTDLVITKDTVNLQVKLSTVAGANRDYIIPVPTAMGLS